MTAFGFRLFYLVVKKNGRGDDQNLEIGPDGEKQHFRDYLEALITTHVDEVVHGNPPRAKDEEPVDEVEDDDDPDEESEPAKRSRPVLMIRNVRLRGDHLVIDFIYGRQQSFTEAGFSEETPAAPVPIAGLKSVQPYRAVFLFPEKGEVGVMAVEDASRSCPSKPLERWLKYWARDQAVRAMEQHKAETGKKKKIDWWSSKLTPMNDPDRLQSVMENGTSTQIVLTKTGGSNARTPGADSLKVEMGLVDPKTTAMVRRALRKWFPSRKEHSSQEEATHDLAAILAERYEGFDTEDYDDAWINVKDANGGTKQISPSRWADIFRYPVAKQLESPGERPFFNAVMAAIQPLEKSLEIELEWSGWR